MKRIILAALVGVLVSGPAIGETFLSYADPPCPHFTEFYAKSGLKWGKTDNFYPTWTNTQFGYRLNWILGYLTYANRNAVPSGNVLRDKGMEIDDAVSWIGSWCRDHPSESVADAIDALIEK